MTYTYYFEKLDVWDRAIYLAQLVYKITNDFPREEKYGIINQMRRASISISSNLAEGSSRTSFKEQARFTEIAYSSTMELLNQIILSEKLGFLSIAQLNELRKIIEEISNKLNSLKRTQLSKVKEDTVEYNTTNSSSQAINFSAQHLNSSNPQIPDSLSHFFAHETAVIDEGCEIGAGTKIWHFSHIMPNCRIGKSCNIGQNVVISPEVVLGNNVKVQNNVSIYTGVTCEDDVFLGPSMVFTNIINPRSAVNRRGQYAKTRVGRGASIGANATIVCGNDIGEYAFIGAGAVVTKYVPSYALVVGNPARQIGWMSEYGHRLEFKENGEATCPESKENYRLEEGRVVKLLSC